MFKDSPEGTTHSYNDGCGEPAHNFPSPYCGCGCDEPEELCGFMILTPHYHSGHNGGLWCAEKKPCKLHGEGKNGTCCKDCERLDCSLSRSTYKNNVCRSMDCNKITCHESALCKQHRGIELLKIQVSTQDDTQEDKNGHKINDKKELIFDDRCRGCDSPKTQAGWEDRLAVLTSVMLGGKQFRELSPLIDFIHSLITQIREEEREKVARHVVEFIKGKSERVTKDVWYVAEECLESAASDFFTKKYYSHKQEENV